MLNSCRMTSWFTFTFLYRNTMKDTCEENKRTFVRFSRFLKIKLGWLLSPLSAYQVVCLLQIMAGLVIAKKFHSLCLIKLSVTFVWIYGIDFVTRNALITKVFATFIAVICICCFWGYNNLQTKSKIVTYLIINTE